MGSNDCFATTKTLSIFNLGILSCWRHLNVTTSNFGWLVANILFLNWLGASEDVYIGENSDSRENVHRAPIWHTAKLCLWFQRLQAPSLQIVVFLTLVCSHKFFQQSSGPTRRQGHPAYFEETSAPRCESQNACQWKLIRTCNTWITQTCVKSCLNKDEAPFMCRNTLPFLTLCYKFC